MLAHVYKSHRKTDTYVYLARRDDFEVLPKSVRDPLGELSFVLAVELTPERRLAHVDAAQVREQLEQRGFFLQLPPSPAEVLAALIKRDDG